MVLRCLFTLRDLYSGEGKRTVHTDKGHRSQREAGRMHVHQCFSYIAVTPALYVLALSVVKQ